MCDVGVVVDLLQVIIIYGCVDVIYMVLWVLICFGDLIVIELLSYYGLL